MGENKGSFFATLIVMFVLFLSWIAILFNLKGVFYNIQLVLAVLFLLTGFKLTFGKDQWKGLIKFYMLIWINFLVIYFTRFSMKEVILPFIVTGAGYLVALIKVDDDEIDLDEDDEKDSEIKKEFSPGKYIASKSGKKYHAPKCDWAKKIKKANQVWFDSKEEAESEKLEACDCVN